MKTLAIIGFLFIFCMSCYAGDKVYTDQDLKGYRSEESIMKFDETGKYKGELKYYRDDREVWCQRGTALQERIDEARERLKQTEANASEERSAHFWGRPAGKHYDKSWDSSVNKSIDASVNRARKEVERAEKNLTKLGDEAYRKGILPGWLRCQW